MARAFWSTFPIIVARDELEKIVMTDAIVPSWHGNNYQARIFWENALNLLDSTSCVVEVTFEANGPKAFDDVVVKYDPAVARSGTERVVAEYHQVKWHTEYGGRFGYEDLIDPAFIGAQSISLLERLRDARRTAPPGSRFAFITMYRIKDGDPLAKLISGHDKSLLVEKLFDGTTDKSQMGAVRKLWRNHLKLKSDDELRAVITGFRILEGHRSLDELRDSINVRAQVVGLIACTAASSDFRYDELARQLKVRNLNKLNKETLEKICHEENLFSGKATPTNPSLPIAIRSFVGVAADIVGASNENTLFLTDEFRQRYLRDDIEWQRDIRPKVEQFLRGAAHRSQNLRLIMDAHASIAFIAGTVLDLKSGISVELLQKGRVGSRIWRADDKSAKTGAAFGVTTHLLGAGRAIAIGIGVARAVDSEALSYIPARLPDIGKYLSFALPSGPGQQVVAGGEHASVLADQVANVVRDIKSSDVDAVVHIFAACPNALLFFLGQHHRGIAPCVVYEFDFDRRGNKTYQPSFVIE